MDKGEWVASGDTVTFTEPPQDKDKLFLEKYTLPANFSVDSIEVYSGGVLLEKGKEYSVTKGKDGQHILIFLKNRSMEVTFHE